jgi:uncharacterized protein YceK
MNSSPSHPDSPVSSLLFRTYPSLVPLLIIFILLPATGCSTIKVHARNHDILHPYLGTEQAVQGFYDSFSDYAIYNQATLMAIDIPLCLAADTIALPYDLVVWLNRRAKPE